MTNSSTSIFEVLDQTECWHLLRTHGVGRLAWASRDDGVQVLPVNYVMLDEETVLFRTSEDSRLAELAAGVDVSFQLDDIDPSTQTGWSVLARGRAAHFDRTAFTHVPDSEPWAVGDRDVFITFRASRLSGRIVSK